MTRDPPEAPAWADFGIAAEDFDARLREIRLFYRMYASRAGKPRWGDETPGYGRRLKAIERLLPEARSSHLVRDGRDAAVSLRGLYAFVDLDFHEAMLRQHEASRGSPRRAPRSE